VAYIEKPFSAEELGAFAQTLLFKREARIEAQQRPAVRVVAPASAESVARRDFCVPGGAFLSDGHTWARLEPDGHVRVGLDDFARKALGDIEDVELPGEGLEVRRGAPLFSVRRGERTVRLASPVSGRVLRLNGALRREPATVGTSPYDRGWVCVIEPADLPADLAELRIGQPAVAWYQEEIEGLREAGGPAEDGAPTVDWETLERRFLTPAILTTP